MKALHYIVLLGCLALNGDAFSQIIERVYKGPDGIWRGDISGPITTYPKKGVVIVDTTAIPDPVPVPPPVQYTNVDNKDAAMVYTPAWTHNGSTTATGFFNNTMAYDATAGKTVTLSFTGTYIEVFCEKKVGHGSAAFQVDSQPVVTIPLGVAGPVGSTSVFKADLPAGNHTFKLTIAGGGNVVFDYVKIVGQVIAPPTPPVTGAIFLMPGVSMKTAVETASSGTAFKLGNGAYPENIVNVPIGVSILPPDAGTAYIDYTGGTINPGSSTQAIFQLSSSPRTNGNQTISGFTIRGAYRSNGGIYVDGRDNVKINIKVYECTFFGMWFHSSSVEVYNSELVNNSWASSGWCSGEINLSGTTKVNIHHSLFRNDHKNAQGVFDKGYGIKGLKWHSVDGRFSGVMEYNTFELYPTSLWKNSSSPNIDVEFESAYVDAGDCIIQYNNLKNMASMAGHKLTGNTGKWIVRNNTFSLQSGSTTVIESSCNNLIVKDNIMRGAPIMSANYNNTRYNDQLFEGNDFVSNNANPGWAGTIYIGAAGVDNFIYRNNKITTGPLTNGFTLIKYAGVQCCVTDGGGNVIN